MASMNPPDPAPTAAGIRVQIAGGERVWTFDRRFSIGREARNDVVVPDGLVSQHHAEVTLVDGEWHIRDLDSTNGTFIDGRQATDGVIDPPARVTLGRNGPTLLFTSSALDTAARVTVAVPPPRESELAERYFGERPPENMGLETAKIRRIAVQQRRKHAKKYVIAISVLAVVAISIGGIAYWQRQQIKRQRAAAADLFYAAKALELEVSRLQLTQEERQSIRARQADLERRYQEVVEALGIYGEGTPETEQTVYRVIRGFGESEANVPREFVDEVLRYVERWKRNDELQEAVERAASNGYGRRIAEIMLAQGLPPEFFYLALQESRLKVEAVGPATRVGFAKGMWQFMPATGRAYGLELGPLVGQPRPDPLDERQDFEKATRAAAEYLYDIYTTDAQASGLLVIASYNWGQTNMLRLIRSMPESPQERNFWNLLTRYRDRIPRETYGYVFNIVAAAVIGENPRLFGFDFDPPLPQVEALTG